VVFGRTSGFPAIFELRTLLPAYGGDGSQGVIFYGADEGDESAWAVSGAGDLNDDGIDDVVIGADLADPHGLNAAGESYVVFGRRSGFPAEFELGKLFPTGGGDGREGFVLEGAVAEDRAGFSVSGAGDLNGDGVPDIMIGAFSADPGGASYVVFGRAGAEH
jgi:hypothetical protein